MIKTDIHGIKTEKGVTFLTFPNLSAQSGLIHGFSTRLGKRVLHEYKWSDVTDAQDGRKVFVQGKRLLTDHTFDEFPEFYKMARAACKGKGKPTPPSEKKQKSRKKNSR